MALAQYPTLRATKGGPLTFGELDANFKLLNNVFISDAQPTGQTQPYLWIQTNVDGQAGKVTIWIEDGN